MSDAGLDDLQGPAGNTYDKYETRNPAARLLVQRFLRELDGQVAWSNAGSILDVGCGEGIGTERMAAVLPTSRVVGLDVADPGLKAHWDRRSSGAVEFVAGSAYELPFEDGAFELVAAIEVFEHLERPGQALREMARVSSRGVLISVPWEPVWRVVNLMSLRYVRELGNTPGHINHWTRRQIVALAGGAGDVVAVRRPFPWTIVAVHVRP